MVRHPLDSATWFAPVLLPATLVVAVAVSASAAETSIVLHDVTDQTGITFRHTDGGTGKYRIVEYVSAGLATFDYDGDGLIDIYFLNGAPEHADGKTVPRNALYRNVGGFRFVDASELAGVADSGHGLGVSAADYDGDGLQDVYVNNYGPNKLYRNNGDGTFEDATIRAGVGGGDRVGAGVAFLDYDRDGLLDLFVSNYIQYRSDDNFPVTLRGMSSYPSPRCYQPDPDVLFSNQGDGSFRDVSGESGIGSVAGAGMGVVASDYDHDGDTDIFVCNDQDANFFFVNDGNGHFTEEGLLLGTALDLSGNPHGSMGVDCGDYDNDGRPDFLMTDYQSELPALFRNINGDYFADVTRLTGIGATAGPDVTWGVGWVDFDNDGDLDLFIASGHLEIDIEQKDDTARYRAKNILLLNHGDGTFEDVSRSCGDGMRVEQSTRGAAFDDLDNDGDIDVVLLNSRAQPTVLRNDTANRHHWIQVRLRGREPNCDAIGARVRITSGTLIQTKEVRSGRGYQSHYGTQLHFGLGDRERIDKIEIAWPDGRSETFHDLPTDRQLVIVQGSSDHR